MSVSFGFLCKANEIKSDLFFVFILLSIFSLFTCLYVLLLLFFFGNQNPKLKLSQKRREKGIRKMHDSIKDKEIYGRTGKQMCSVEISVHVLHCNPTQKPWRKNKMNRDDSLVGSERWKEKVDIFLYDWDFVIESYMLHSRHKYTKI